MICLLIGGIILGSSGQMDEYLYKVGLKKKPEGYTPLTVDPLTGKPK